MQKYITFANELSFFRAFELEESLAILGILKERRLSNRELLVKQGDRAQSCFFLVEGQIRVFIAQGEHSKDLAMLKPGAIFGHLALIDRGKRSATCTSVGDSVVLEMDWSDFDLMFSSANSAAFKFTDALTRLLVQQLRHITDQISDMAAQAASMEDPGELDLSEAIDAATSKAAGGFDLDQVEVVPMEE